MEKTGFTPGPWSADENVFYLNSYDSERHIRSSERHWSVCVTYQMSGCSDLVRDISADEERANARLIAAAPELYEVLKDMLSPYDGFVLGEVERRCDPVTFERIKKARVALSKVEGYAVDGEEPFSAHIEADPHGILPRHRELLAGTLQEELDKAHGAKQLSADADCIREDEFVCLNLSYRASLIALARLDAEKFKAEG